MKGELMTSCWVKRIAFFFIQFENIHNLSQSDFSVASHFDILACELSPFIFSSKSIEKFLFISKFLISCDLLLKFTQDKAKDILAFRSQTRCLGYWILKLIYILFSWINKLIILMKIINELWTKSTLLCFFLYYRFFIYLVFKVPQKFGSVDIIFCFFTLFYVSVTFLLLILIIIKILCQSKYNFFLTNRFRVVLRLHIFWSWWI